jgi:nicotinamide-nucleotide amidase
MTTDALISAAANVLDRAKARGLKLVTAESCTGGLIAASFTANPGSSAAFERGFVTYSNEAKTEAIGVDAAIIAAHGAVSEQTARAMAEGALRRSRADVSVAVTGVAGPDGGSAEKPVGLVHFAAARAGRATLHERHEFGAIGRVEVQRATVAAALALMDRLID